MRFYDRKEVKDFIAFLRLRANANDEIALKRVLDCLRFGVGPKTLQHISTLAGQARQPLLLFIAKDLPQQACCAGKGKKAARLREFSQWCRELVELEDDCLMTLALSILEHSDLQALIKKGYDAFQADERLEHLDSLLGRVQEYVADNPDAGLTDFLTDLALVSDVDNHDPQSNSITLMTLHSSKGLEFPYVMIAGVENGLLPHTNSCEEEEKLAEERRLFYVGITRAQKAVFLLHCNSRFYHGQRDYNRQPSCFLEELPSNQACCKFNAAKAHTQQYSYSFKPKYQPRKYVFPDDEFPCIYQD